MEKTTTAFNLAAYFTKKGYKTIVIDTDPQGNLTTNYGITGENLDAPSVGDYLLKRTTNLNRSDKEKSWFNPTWVQQQKVIWKIF